MLRIENLVVNYGGIEAVKNVSISVPEKEIVALIGANGAGKSTILRTVAGLVRPQSGRIFYSGADGAGRAGQNITGKPEPNITNKPEQDIIAKPEQDITGKPEQDITTKPEQDITGKPEQDITGYPPYRIVSMGITMVPEGRRVFADLTVGENLKIGAYLRKDNIKDDLDWVYNLFPRLKERSWQTAGTLSGGEQQMLAVGRALMSRPRLMMMDEPSLGLAPLIVKDIFDIIKEINRQGVTILLIEQNANVALHAADTAYVLESGRLVTSGAGGELLNNEAVKKAYLG